MHSKRTAARLIVRNGLGGVLLVRFQSGEEHWWATPGGGLDGDETLAEAAHREAVEELGVPVVLRDEVWRRTATFTSLSGVLTEQTEHYFRAEVNENHISPDLHRLRDESVTDVRWWTLDELSTTTETIYPDGLCDLLAGLPEHPVGTPIQVQ